MSRKWSLYLGGLSGIKVYVHWSFWIIIPWIFLMHFNMGQGAEGLWGVLFVLALFGCVVLHEFGHALTAKKFSILTRDITIYPIGGVASLEAIPEKPSQELLVALAGPLVNLGIAAFLWVYLQAAGQWPDIPALQAAAQDAHMLSLPFGFNLFVANIVLAVFNLVPAFPMDGGRVLRALLAFRMSRARATRIAATVGQLLAIAFVFIGFFYNFWLVFIGLFVYLGAGGEAAFEAANSALGQRVVNDVFMRRYSCLRPDETLQKAVDLLLNGQDKEFLVVDGEKVLGVLTRKDLIRGLAERGSTSLVSSIMHKDYVTFSPQMPLQGVYQKMQGSGYTYGPVLDKGVLIGPLDRANIEELLMVKAASGKG
ncbi:site-2 protease family protein [Pontibacter saemangeumensis]|uniref:Zinc metalloprotease n=1 Tax=Pontibacter saemangeumensis TaxID=1084525 RepID=A0ABP8LIC7_9BACT